MQHTDFCPGSTLGRFDIEARSLITIHTSSEKVRCDEASVGRMRSLPRSVIVHTISAVSAFTAIPEPSLSTSTAFASEWNPDSHDTDNTSHTDQY